MTSRTSSYRNSLLIALRDPVEASAYLNAALEDSQEAFLKALKNVAQARQMSTVARDAGIQRETLYRSFSEQGNPTLETLSSVLGALGMKLSIAVSDLDTTPLPADTSGGQISVERRSA
jgi:probable addiction module antidote protein